MNITRTQTRPEDTWIVVCTYQRHDLLRALLESLRTVWMPAESTLRYPQLIVIDNAEQPTAQGLVEEIYPEAIFGHEPRPGIATARNTSVETLPPDAAAVIFLDDDERVSPGWFTALLDCADRSDADGVGGPVVPVFPAGEPDWVASYGFVRRTDFPTGPHQRRLATNNTLVRAHWFTEYGFRFDERFNFTGGSDSDLFERMLNAGAQYWWCAEAVVSEEVPEQRATRMWLRRRALRGGTVRAMKRRGSQQRSPTVAAARIAAEGCARAGYGSLRRAGKRLRGSQVTYTDDYYLCEGLGMLLNLTGRGRDEYGRSA